MNNILKIFNQILEGQDIQTVSGEVFEYTTGNIYIIEDIYNTVYKYNAIHNKYYLVLAGVEIEYKTLNELLWYAKWLNK